MKDLNEQELRSCMNDPAWNPQWDVWATPDSEELDSPPVDDPTFEDN